MNSLHKILKQVTSSQDYSLLEPLKDPAKWKTISSDDKKALAKLFLQSGRRELEMGAVGPLPTFDIAQRLNPGNLSLLLEQARLYAHYSESVDNLCCALDLIEEIEGYDANLLAALITGADVLVELGLRREEPLYFNRAHDKYDQIETCHTIPEEDVCEFYWHWGICWHYIAKQSGEAGDFVTALGKYQKAETLGLEDPVFLNDYGNALVDLACLVSRSDLLTQASQLYHRVTDMLPDFFEGMMNLACTDHQLWQMTGDDKYFYTSAAAFERGAKLDPDEAALWFKWAQLLFYTGKLQGNPGLIEESFDKFLKANTLLPDHAQILSEWADAHLTAGIQLEKLDYLKSSQVSIIRALELEPEEAIHWSIYARTLIELGRYFQEDAYLATAIEKLNYALSLHRSDPHLWHGLASCYHLLSDFKSDKSLCEKSVKYYSRVTEFNGEMHPDFWNEWGVALMKMGSYTQDRRWVEAASEKFEQAIRLFYLIHEPSTINPTWLYNYGTALDFLGDFTHDERYYEKAIKVLSQSLNLDPTHYQAKYHLACCFSHLGEIVSDVDCFEKGLELFRDVLSDDPEDDEAWIDWGLALLNLAELVADPAHSPYVDKLLAEAEEKFMRGASLGNETSFYYLACLYSMQKRLPEALHYLERSKVVNALPPVDELLHEEWLGNLRQYGHFQEFLKNLKI